MDIKLKARAKINLTLDIKGKRPDGYHDLLMVMQTVSLYDEIAIANTTKDNEIKVHSNWRFLPNDERNLAYQAAALFKHTYGIDEGLRINIKKAIPVGAGLAGGSADCAAVLVGLNKLYQLKISAKELMELGVQLGADVPFCIMRGTALADGIGENLKKLSPCPFAYIVIAKPKFSISTASVFQNVEVEKITQHPNTALMIDAIESQSICGVAGLLRNVLENFVFDAYPDVRAVKEFFLRQNALGALMSGTGSGVFAVFIQKHQAEAAAEKIKKQFQLRDVFVTTIFNVSR